MFATSLDQMDGVGGVAALVMNVKKWKKMKPFDIKSHQKQLSKRMLDLTKK